MLQFSWDQESMSEKSEVVRKCEVNISRVITYYPLIDYIVDMQHTVPTVPHIRLELPYYCYTLPLRIYR